LCTRSRIFRLACGRSTTAKALSVTFVGRPRDFVIVVEVGDPLVHGTPIHLVASLALDPAANLKLTGVVDDRLDTQDLAKLVVHLQPVVLDPVLDAGPRPAVFLAIGQHLAVETRVQAAAQKAQDVLSGEVQTGMVEQTRVEVGQGGALLKEDIGAVFGLVDDPVIALALEPGLAQERVDLTRPAIQDLDPAEPREAVGQGLGLERVVELGEGIVVLHEAAARVVELPREPVMAVDIDLRGEGEPGLDADVAEAELGIEEVEVENTLRAAGEDESGAALAIAEFDGAAGLLAAKDADEALAQAARADLLLDEVFLAVVPLEVLVRGAVLGGEVFGVANDECGFFLREDQEIFTLDAEGMINKAVKVGLIGEREMSLEDYAIMAGKNGDDGRGELDEKRVRRWHGVLLQKGISTTPF